MPNYLEPLSLHEFAHCVSSDVSLWERAYGSLIEHTFFSEGELVRVTCAGRSPERCSVEIQFPKDGRKTFNLATVMDGTYFSTIKLPTACEDIYQKVVTCSESNPHFRLTRMDREKQKQERLREQEEERTRDEERLREAQIRKREAAEAQYRLRVAAWEENTGRNWSKDSQLFMQLSQKYAVPLSASGVPLDESNAFPDDPLFDALLRLDSDEELQSADFQLFADRGAPFLANNRDQIRVSKREFTETQNVAILAVISRLWRELGQSDKALEATGQVIQPDHTPRQDVTPYEESMLLTTRAASFRDLEDIGRARACVERAVERNPRSYRAHRLRAAIAIDLGDFETAERSFALCEELEPEVTPEGLRTAEFKRRRFPAEFAAFLLDRDPVRFHWAKRYLLKH